MRLQEAYTRPLCVVLCHCYTFYSCTAECISEIVALGFYNFAASQCEAVVAQAAERVVPAEDV
jgi:hypothetical protein